MSKLVVDTNVLLSSFISAGPPRLILNRIRDRLDLLCVSPSILEEYFSILQRVGIAEDLLASLLSFFQDPGHVWFYHPSALRSYTTIPAMTCSSNAQSKPVQTMSFLAIDTCEG